MKLLTAALFLLVLVGAGCLPKPSTPPPVNAPVEEISVSIDGSWELETFTAPGKAEQDVSAIGATLTVEAGTRLSAKICNSMSGAYDIDAGVLKAGALVSTKMFCDGLPGEIETAFSQGLSTGLAIEHGGDTLVLRGESGVEFSHVRSASDEPAGAPSEDVSGGDRAYAGVVASVDLEQMKVDGPAVIVVRTASGAEVKILVPARLGLCKASAATADVYALKVGQSVEARGSVGAEKDSIVPCESEAHYLRVVASSMGGR